MSREDTDAEDQHRNQGRGKCLRYRLQNGELLIACLKGDRSIRIPLSDVPGLIAELQELMAIGGMA